MTDFLMLTTRDLMLVAATAAMLRADLGSGSPAGLLDATPPAAWPPECIERDDIERALAAVEAPGAEPGWQLWYLLTRSSRRLVGTAGLGNATEFISGPQATVMLGFSIVPEARRQGFATQATEALVEFAFANARVETVAAETFPNLVASIGVLTKCGFIPADPAHTPGAIRFARRRRRG